MKKTFVLIFCLPLFAFAQKQIELAPNDWQWLNGASAEQELVLLGWELEKGVKGWKVSDQVPDLSKWLSVPSDNLQQAPKSFRIEPKFERHLAAPPPVDVTFTFQSSSSGIPVPLISFGGEIRGLSVKPNSPEKFIYLNITRVNLVPGPKRRNWNDRKNQVACEICDVAGEFLQNNSNNFVRSVNKPDVVTVIHIPANPDDPIEISVSNRKDNSLSGAE